MKIRTLLIAATVATAVPDSVTQIEMQSATTAFVGVNVLTMDTDAVLGDHTVIVSQGKIVSVTPAAKAQVPAGAVRIEAKGKFLMPGLAEMHAHIPGGAAPDQAVERTLFTALNKNTQALHHELVRFDPAAAQRLSDKAVAILRAADAGELPPRLATTPDHHACRFCPFPQRCWSAAA